MVTRAMELMAERQQAQAHDQVIVDADLSAITAKAMIVHSMDDDQCPADNAYALRDRLPGSELVVVDWQIVMQMRGPYDIGANGWTSLRGRGGEAGAEALMKDRENTLVDS